MNNPTQFRLTGIAHHQNNHQQAASTLKAPPIICPIGPGSDGRRFIRFPSLRNALIDIGQRAPRCAATKPELRTGRPPRRLP